MELWELNLEGDWILGKTFPWKGKGRSGIGTAAQGWAGVTFLEGFQSHGCGTWGAGAVLGMLGHHLGGLFQPKLSGIP